MSMRTCARKRQQISACRAALHNSKALQQQQLHAPSSSHHQRAGQPEPWPARFYPHLHPAWTAAVAAAMRSAGAGGELILENPWQNSIMRLQAPEHPLGSPVGPRKRKELPRCRAASPARLRSTASATAATASSCPTCSAHSGREHSSSSAAQCSWHADSQRGR